MPEGILLYDGRCRFCRWSAAKVLGLDRKRALRPLDLHSAEASELLAGISEEEKLGSWHLVSASSRYSAGQAFAPLLDLLPLGRLPARMARAMPGIVERAYGVVAARRSALGRLVTDRADRRAAGRISDRA